MITPEQVLQAARGTLLGTDAVTEGWSGRGVELVDGQLLVTFTWMQLPCLFAVRLDLDDVNEPIWTGGPQWSAQAWVDELVLRLMEECETGAVAWLPRHERDGRIELLLDEPRVGQLPPDRLAAYYVSWFRRPDRGDELWAAFVNNPEGHPMVAELLVTSRGGRAELAVDVP